jgi:hypothetical protein
VLKSKALSLGLLPWGGHPSHGRCRTHGSLPSKKFLMIEPNQGRRPWHVDVKDKKRGAAVRSASIRSPDQFGVTR